MTPAANMDSFSPKFDAFRRDLKNIKRSSVKVHSYCPRSKMQRLKIQIISF